jgi:hypothetical protein
MGAVVGMPVITGTGTWLVDWGTGTSFVVCGLGARVVGSDVSMAWGTNAVFTG